MNTNEPLYMQMRSYLLDLIARNQHVPGYKLPSENQLALRFGASRISSRHALNMLQEEGLIIRQQGRGSYIADASRHPAPHMRESPEDAEDAIALIVPFIRTIFMSEIIEGIQEALGKKGLHFILFLTDNDQRKETKYLRLAQERFRGILLFPGAYAKYHEEALRLVLNRFPLVQVDRYLPGLDLSYVASDHRGATYRATQFLFARGHERISFIGHLLGHASSVVERFHGFEQAAQEHSATYPGFFKLNVEDSAENFEELFRGYMREVNPTAIISTGHLHAPSIMKVLKAMGKERDVELMLYDNEYTLSQPFMAYHPFVIDQQPRRIGHTAAQLVYELAYQGVKPANILLPERIYQI